VVGINATLDDILKLTPVGSVSRAIGNSFFGINHQATPNLVPADKISQGLVLFTRPQLNLKEENLRCEDGRIFIPILTKNEASIQRIIRCTLDPRLNKNEMSCPFVDPLQAFIPILTNQCLSMTPWPDEVSETYTSEPGRMKEVFSFIDSSYKNYGVTDQTATFRNTDGSPIMLMLRIWRAYASYVFEGKMLPYPDYMYRNWIDYQSRVYRLVLDKHRRTVKHIACTGASFPIASPYGSIFNYDTNSPFNSETKEIQVPFRSIGMWYDDPIIINQFNRVVALFNENMKDQYRDDTMTEVPMSSLSFFNHKGYPRIDPDSFELKWYVHRQVYTEQMTAVRETIDTVSARQAIIEAFQGN